MFWLVRYCVEAEREYQSAYAQALLETVRKLESEVGILTVRLKRDKGVKTERKRGSKENGG